MFRRGIQKNVTFLLHLIILVSLGRPRGNAKVLNPTQTWAMTTSNQTLNMAIALRSKHHKNELMRLQSIMEEQQPSLTYFVQSMI